MKNSVCVFFYYYFTTPALYKLYFYTNYESFFNIFKVKFYIFFIFKVKYFYS